MDECLVSFDERFWWQHHAVSRTSLKIAQHSCCNEWWYLLMVNHMVTVTVASGLNVNDAKHLNRMLPLVTVQLTVNKYHHFKQDSLPVETKRCIARGVTYPSITND